MFILVLIILLIFIYFYKKNNYLYKYNNYNKYNNDNYTIPFRQCILYNETGVCIDGNDNYKCIKGDSFGPYDKTIKCKRWYHNDPFSRYINENNYHVDKPYI